jgi:hypothetical protein
VCNHRASPNRHLSSILKNGCAPANMPCAGRATVRISVIFGPLDARPGRRRFKMPIPATKIAPTIKGMSRCKSSGANINSVDVTNTNRPIIGSFAVQIAGNVFASEVVYHPPLGALACLSGDGSVGRVPVLQFTWGSARGGVLRLMSALAGQRKRAGRDRRQAGRCL